MVIVDHQHGERLHELVDAAVAHGNDLLRRTMRRPIRATVKQSAMRAP
jgi:hypothetical protein